MQSEPLKLLWLLLLFHCNLMHVDAAVAITLVKVKKSITQVEAPVSPHDEERKFEDNSDKMSNYDYLRRLINVGRNLFLSRNLSRQNFFDSV